MPDLERTLAELGAAWAPPPTPDVAAAVVASLPPRPRRGLVRSRRLRIAIAAVAVVAGAVAAIAPARDAILDLFDIGAVRVTTAPAPGPAPTATAPRDADLGSAATFDSARAQAPFTVLVPDDAVRGTPDDVFVRTPGPSAIVTFVWRDRAGRIDALLMEARGTLLMEKFVDPDSPAVTVDVAGVRGYWLAGGPHTFGFLDRGELDVETTRLADNVLLWTRDGVTFRLEGFPLAASLRLARGLR